MSGNRVLYYLSVSGMTILVIVMLWAALSAMKRTKAPTVYVVARGSLGEYQVGTSTPDAVKMGLVICSRQQVGVGLVFDRIVREQWSLQFLWDTTPNSQQMIDEARGAVVAQLVADGYGTSPGFSAQKLAAGDYSVSTHSLRGYVLDATAYLVLIGAGVAWVRGLLWAGRADARDARARLDHVCINCGYDARGLKTTICPECGERV